MRKVGEILRVLTVIIILCGIGAEPAYYAQLIWMYVLVLIYSAGLFTGICGVYMIQPAMWDKVFGITPPETYRVKVKGMVVTVIRVWEYVAASSAITAVVLLLSCLVYNWTQ